MAGIEPESGVGRRDTGIAQAGVHIDSRRRIAGRRRAHGAAFVTWVGVEESRARIDDAQATLRWYASSPGAERGFCSHCGSMLFFRGQRWPGELHIVRANFDEPVDREPQVHVHYDTHVDWVALDPADGLPRKP